MHTIELTDQTYHKLWKGVPTFCNVYSEDTYVSAKYKNDTALIYVDDDAMDTDILFPQTSSLFNPWIIGLIQPEDLKGFRFNICTRTNFPRHQPLDKNKPSELTIDFESIFWNNLLYLDQNLKGSVEYTTHCMMKIQQAVNQGNNRTRTRSISRTSSIPTIGKLFNNNSVENHPIQRRSSPSQLKKAKSFSPPPPLQAPKRVPVHHSWSAGNGGNVGENTSVTSLWSPLHNNEKELLDTVSFYLFFVLLNIVPKNINFRLNLCNPLQIINKKVTCVAPQSSKRCFERASLERSHRLVVVIVAQGVRAV